MCAWVCVECKEINKQKTIKLFCYYTRVQVANISRYDTHTHTHLHTYMPSWFIRIENCSKSSAKLCWERVKLKERAREREKGTRKSATQNQNIHWAYVWVCVCVCTHSYIISTYRTKRGTTTTKREQERERGELQKHDWQQQTGYSGARSIETCLATSDVQFTTRLHCLHHCAHRGRRQSAGKSLIEKPTLITTWCVILHSLLLLLLLMFMFMFELLLLHCCCCCYSCSCCSCCCCCLCGALSIVPRALVLLFVAKRWRRQRHWLRQWQRQRYRIHIFSFLLFLFSVAHWFIVVVVGVSADDEKCATGEASAYTFWCIDSGREGVREGEATEDAAGATRTRILIVVCVGVCVCERWAACQRWQVLGMAKRYISPQLNFPLDSFFLVSRSALRFELLL